MKTENKMFFVDMAIMATTFSLCAAVFIWGCNSSSSPVEGFVFTFKNGSVKEYPMVNRGSRVFIRHKDGFVSLWLDEGIAQDTFIVSFPAQDIESVRTNMSRLGPLER